MSGKGKSKRLKGSKSEIPNKRPRLNNLNVGSDVVPGTSAENEKGESSTSSQPVAASVRRPWLAVGRRRRRRVLPSSKARRRIRNRVVSQSTVEPDQVNDEQTGSAIPSISSTSNEPNLIELTLPDYLINERDEDDDSANVAYESDTELFNLTTRYRPSVPTPASTSSTVRHLVPGAVQGESYCKCSPGSDSRDLQCSCGEEENECLEWTWDTKDKSSACDVLHDGKEVRFHSNYSSGTAAARGNMPLVEDRQYFWEIRMVTPVYGTDMMVGVGSKNVELDSHRYHFCSMIGRDEESWGWSYYGKSQHGGASEDIYCGRFGQGTIVGLHLDTWRGQLSVYKNREPLGVVFTGLRGKVLYPMIASTAARTGMRLLRASSFKTSLSFMCCMTLRKFVPKYLDVTRAIFFPPGLQGFLMNNLGWLLRAPEQNTGESWRNMKYKLDKGKRKASIDSSASSASIFDGFCHISYRPVERTQRSTERSIVKPVADKDDDDEASSSK